eukprot:TRINITY_DN435_c0_g1_i3.p1 TRINITY_DN435_c0_g1~~TRINITY_DN435_c0_g1_i3.p1  ORF type:complete len:201 (+),score=75.99 TRINITY_DN435_c0_g1_i3:51-605(+)
MYYAWEQTDCCTRMCCGSHRPFTINIFNNQRQTLLTLTRPLRLDSSWFLCLPINCCCLQDLSVCDATGAEIGHIVQRFSLCSSVFDVRDSAGVTVATLTGPCIVCQCLTADWQVTGPQGQELGVLRRHVPDLARAIFTDADTFTVNFPTQMPVKHKALLMSAIFLIDFIFFEQDGTEHHNNIGA